MSLPLESTPYAALLIVSMIVNEHCHAAELEIFGRQKLRHSLLLSVCHTHSYAGNEADVLLYLNNSGVVGCDCFLEITQQENC